jgi:hypothetical protein
MRHPLFRLRVASAAASLIFAASASTATFRDTVTLSPDATVTVDQSLTVDFNVETESASISSVCLYFKFATDLLDPGDLLRIAFIEDGEEI